MLSRQVSLCITNPNTKKVFLQTNIGWMIFSNFLPIWYVSWCNFHFLLSLIVIKPAVSMPHQPALEWLCGEKPRQPIPSREFPGRGEKTRPLQRPRRVETQLWAIWVDVDVFGSNSKLNLVDESWMKIWKLMIVEYVESSHLMWYFRFDYIRFFACFPILLPHFLGKDPRLL